MKKESPETVKRRLGEEQVRLEEYSREEIIVSSSTIDMHTRLRSMFRALSTVDGQHVKVFSDDAAVSPTATSPRVLTFHPVVDLMEHCMFEMEEEEVEAEEEERRVQESLGEDISSLMSPRTARTHAFRDLTVLHDGEERKEKLVEKALDNKVDDDDSTKPIKATNEDRTTTTTTTAPTLSTTIAPTPTTTTTTTTTADTTSTITPSTPIEKDKDATPRAILHEKLKTGNESTHEKHDRARMTLMHRTASGGTLLPGKGGEAEGEVGDVKKGRAMALAPRARRQTAATEPGQPASPTARIMPVMSGSMGLAAMKAAMEEKAKLYRPPGAKAKVLPGATAEVVQTATAQVQSAVTIPDGPSPSNLSHDPISDSRPTIEALVASTTTTVETAASPAEIVASVSPMESAVIDTASSLALSSTHTDAKSEPSSASSSSVLPPSENGTSTVADESISQGSEVSKSLDSEKIHSSEADSGPSSATSSSDVSCVNSETILGSSQTVAVSSSDLGSRAPTGDGGTMPEA